MLTAPGSATTTAVPLPARPPGAVRVRVEGCGLCGSNLPVWEGRPWFDYPLAPGAPGHEAWGTVLESDGGPAAGERVALLADQALVEVVDVPPRRAVPLPPSLTGPFPGEALGCAFNVAARSGFGPGQLVAVVGAGFLGAVVGALAAEAGAHVVALSRRPSALELARSWGAKDVVRLGTGDPVEQVLGLTGGELCDVVVEAVGLQEPLDVAARLTRERGRLVVAGFHQDGPRTVDLQLWNWRGLDVVNAHERDDATRVRGIQAAVDAAAAGRLDVAQLVTHEVPAELAGEAFALLAQRPEGFVKAVVTL